MPYILELHKVEDYDKWQEVFDKDNANREASGSRGARIFRSIDDPADLVILFEWDSLEKARQRSQSDALRQKFQEAGVSGGVEQTKFYFLEEVGRAGA
jgi:heme-degrading monooxygenase HmoA